MRRDHAQLTTASIWRLMWVHRVEIVKSWDFLLAAGLALSAGLLLDPTPGTVRAFCSAAMAVSSTILGITLAGLAVLTAFLRRRYIAVLDRVGHGVATEVFGFRYPASLAVASVVFSGVMLVSRDEPWYGSALPWLLGMTVFLFLYTLFATLNLVASLGGHMMNRSLQAMQEEEQCERD